MGLFGQMKLSFQMTVAAFKMTMRYPQSLLVALGNLVFLTLVAVGPLSFILWLAFHDGATTAQKDLAYSLWKYVFQWWIVDIELREAAANPSTEGFEDVVGAFMLWGLVVYFIWATIVTFASLVTATVIMHTGVQQLRGQKPSIADGFALAGRNILRLLGLAIIAGFLLALTKRILSLLKVVPFLGKWIQRAVMAAITFTLYLILPVVVYERNGVWSAVKNTWTHVRKTWGGLVIGTGFIMTALWVGLWVIEIAVFTMLGQAGVDVRKVDWGTILVLQVVAAVVLYCFNIALSANLRAALYLHVTENHTGVIPAGAIAKVEEKPAPGPGPIRA